MGKKLNRKSWVVQRLRRLSMKWPPRNAVKKANRREYYKTRKDGSKYAKPNFEYQCNMCKNWFADKDTCMDHIEPIIDIDQDKVSEEEFYGIFVTGLFCDESNFQILCKKCHDLKTKSEQEERFKNKSEISKSKK